MSSVDLIELTVMRITTILAAILTALSLTLCDLQEPLHRPLPNKPLLSWLFSRILEKDLADTSDFFFFLQGSLSNCTQRGGGASKEGGGAARRVSAGARIPICWKRGFWGPKTPFPLALTKAGKGSFRSKAPHFLYVPL